MEDPSIGRVISVHRYASLKEIAAAIACSAFAFLLGGVLLFGRTPSPGMALLLTGLFALGAGALWRQWLIDRSLRVNLGEKGFTLTRAGDTVTVAWSAVASVSLLRINGKTRAYLVRPLQGPEIALRYVLSDFDSLGSEVLARTGARR